MPSPLSQHSTPAAHSSSPFDASVRRSSAANIHSGSGGGGGTPSGRRLGSGLSPSSPHGTLSASALRDRMSPATNACRCLNLSFQCHLDPPLSDGELRAVESLFGTGAGSTPGGSSGGSFDGSAPLFPEGYFIGRPLLRSHAQEGLCSSRPHPRHSSWILRRCLNCHMDSYAFSSAHRLIVGSLRNLHSAEEMRKVREGEHWSRAFGVMIRGNPGGIQAQAHAAASGTSPLNAQGIHASSASTDPSSAAANSILSTALAQLRSSLDHALEAERIAMETRLSQFRAAEESKFAEIDWRMRRDYGALSAQVEKEIANVDGPEGPSPRHPSSQFDPYSRRNSTARLSAHKKGSTGEGLEGMAALAAAAATSDDSDADTTMAAARDATAARNISPSGGMPHSRTSSRGGRDSSTPPSASQFGTSADERAAAAAALHKSASSVVALPLDLHSDSPIGTPLQPRGRRIVPTGTSLPRNAAHLPAAPMLPGGGVVAAALPIAAPTVAAAAVSTEPRMSELRLDLDSAPSGGAGGSTVAPPLETNGVSLVAFDEDSSPIVADELLTSLSTFDEFVLPADGSAAGAGGRRRMVHSEETDTIFALDEEQASPKASSDEDDADDSPRLATRTTEEADDDAAALEGRDSGAAVSEEEDEDVVRRAAPVSNKAAKLLGMMSDAPSAGRSASNSLSSTQQQGSFIRPRASSTAKGGVTMVPMSLPIAIPAQLRAAVDAPVSRPSDAADSIKAASGLGRSLQNAAAKGATSHLPAPAAPPAYSSSDDSDSDTERARRRGRAGTSDDGGDTGAFVPPHTLVEEPDWSFAKVRHLASYKNNAPKFEAPVIAGAGGNSGGGGSGSIGVPSVSSSSSPAFPLSSSVPRVVGSLGAPRQVIRPSDPAAPPPTISKLGFVPTSQPPPPKAGPAAGGAGGAKPSSRNPHQQQQR